MEARQAAYLQQLGVDVWIRKRPRDVAVWAEQQPVSAAEPLPAPEPPPPERTPRSPTPAPVRRSSNRPPPTAPAATAQVEAFRIRCFRYGRVFAALAEDAWPRRRFLLDVARAMNGFDAADREDVVFDWPQPGVDPTGGGRAFRAFLGHQTRNGERSLLSGQRVLDLLDSDGDETRGRIYVAPDPPDANAKKELWRRIRQL